MILKFPNEDEKTAAIRSSLGSHFELAERIYKFWIEYPKDSSLERSNLQKHVLHVSMLLHYQGIRHFRSAFEECYRAEAMGAMIATRSLFETAVAMLFVLKPRVRVFIAVEKSADGRLKYRVGPPSKRNRGKPRTELSQALRASLYLAHVAFDEKRFIEKCGHTPGLKRLPKQAGLTVDQNLIDGFEKLIGPEWSSILTHRPHSYSGFTIADVTKLLSRFVGHRYETIYHFESRIVHAVDALRIGQIGADGAFGPQLVSSEREVIGALQTAIQTLLMCMTIMDKFIGFGSTLRDVRKAFQDEFIAVFGLEKKKKTK